MCWKVQKYRRFILMFYLRTTSGLCSCQWTITWIARTTSIDPRQVYRLRKTEEDRKQEKTENRRRQKRVEDKKFSLLSVYGCFIISLPEIDTCHINNGSPVSCTTITESVVISNLVPCRALFSPQQGTKVRGGACVKPTPMLEITNTSAI